MKLRKYFLTGLFALIFLVTIYNLCFAQNVDDPLSLGQKIKINSKILNEDREVFISTPINYKQTEDKFNVLYVLDADITYGYSASLVKYLSGFGDISGTIVVGIPHIDRFKDLSYNKDKMFDHECNANNFVTFLKQELVPYVNANYRTNSYNILMGHSLGAVFVLYTYANDPSFFDANLIISPDFTRDVLLLKHVQKSFKNVNVDKCFLYISIEKYRDKEFEETYEKFKNMLNDLPKTVVIKHDHFNDESHTSVGPISLLSGLKFIFGNK